MYWVGLGWKKPCSHVGDLRYLLRPTGLFTSDIYIDQNVGQQKDVARHVNNPSGVKAVSRGLSVATPPDSMRQRTSTPAGSQQIGLQIIRVTIVAEIFQHGRGRIALLFGIQRYKES